jgi:phosphohistidine phosphatase
VSSSATLRQIRATYAAPEGLTVVSILVGNREVRPVMRCYLVRHGEALSGFADPARPLSTPGRAEVAELARLALSRNVQVAELLHSGILRAQETAEILAHYLKPPCGVRSTTGLLPEDDPDIAKAEIEAAAQAIMLVGHLPHLARLSAILARADAASSDGAISPATMLCYRKGDASWQIEWRITPDRG